MSKDQATKTEEPYVPKPVDGVEPRKLKNEPKLVKNPEPTEADLIGNLLADVLYSITENVRMLEFPAAYVAGLAQASSTKRRFKAATMADSNIEATFIGFESIVTTANEKLKEITEKFAPKDKPAADSKTTA